MNDKTSRSRQLLDAYAGELEILRAYVPEELGGNPDSYLAIVIKLMITANAGSPPAVSDLTAFMYQVYRTKLDPVARQIYPVYRSGKMAIQTSIDGFRLIADRTGLYGGQDDVSYLEKDGKPEIATVTVYKLNPRTYDRMAVMASARIKEYQAGGPMWSSKPYLMLGKCAEALALRKAFPQELSNLYTTEEMDQSDQPSVREKIDSAVRSYHAGKDPDTDQQPVTGHGEFELDDDFVASIARPSTEE